MQMLADQKGDDLLRLKGLVQLTDHPDRPAVIHGVQHVIHPIRRLDGWPIGIAETRIVLIVRNINEVWVQNLWEQVLGSSYADLIV
jgi:G3E family GTPase